MMHSARSGGWRGLVHKLRKFPFIGALFFQNDISCCFGGARRALRMIAVELKKIENIFIDQEEAGLFRGRGNLLYES